MMRISWANYGPRTRNKRQRRRRSLLGVEALEARQVLSGNGLVGSFVDTAQIELTLTNTRTSVGTLGKVAALPANATYVDEWDIVTAEVWVAVPDDSQGAAAVAVDLAFDDIYLETRKVEFGPGFTQLLPGDDEAVPGVDVLSATANDGGLGVGGFVLFATVEFHVLSVPVDIDLRLIGPIDMDLALSNAVVEASVGGSMPAMMGAMPESELWAMLYDLDEDSRIGFGEFALFSGQFLKEVDSSPDDTTWWADFDKSGHVGFSDLAIFSANFLRSGPFNDVIYPSNFPEAWRKGIIVPTFGIQPPSALAALHTSAADVNAIDAAPETSPAALGYWNYTAGDFGFDPASDHELHGNEFIAIDPTLVDGELEAFAAMLFRTTGELLLNELLADTNGEWLADEADAEYSVEVDWLLSDWN